MSRAPTIGSRWRHQSGNVYEYRGTAGEDPTYCHAMKLVERGAKYDVTPLGHVMTVELPWFEHAATEVSQ